MDTAPEHRCEPPDEPVGLVFFTCPACARTWVRQGIGDTAGWHEVTRE